MNKYLVFEKIKAWFIIWVWIIPITFLGTTHASLPLPSYLQDLYSVSCLFSQRATSWSHYYFHVQHKNASEWIEIPEKDISSMQPFGHRSRVKRMLEIYTDDTAFETRKLEICNYIRDKYKTLYNRDVKRVKISRAVFEVGGAIAQPLGKWKKPSFPELDPALVYVIKDVKYP